MAYADQQGLSTNRILAIIFVVLLHVLLLWALATGLAFEAVKKVKASLDVVDVKEKEPPKDEEPPPEPDKQIEPPVVTPPPLVNVPSPPATFKTVQNPPPSAPLIPTAAPPAPSAPPPPPPPVAKRPNPIPKGNAGNWVTTNDYPSRDLQQEHAGVTGVRLSIGPDGRVADCQITSSSGFPGLDAAACSNLKRRARFDPALDGSGNPTSGSWSKSIRWQIPKE